MKKHPLKGWRKILALVLGGAVSSLFPDLAPFVLPLVKTYLIAQGAVDVSEAVGVLRNNGGQ
ncbi:MAG: hypothetical protein ACREB3_00015 [Burkholderiales bacterium]